MLGHIAGFRDPAAAIPLPGPWNSRATGDPILPTHPHLLLPAPWLSLPHPHPRFLPLRSEVRKTLIGRAMCERYAAHFGLSEYLVMGKSYRSG